MEAAALDFVRFDKIFCSGYEKNARFAYWKLKCAVSAQETAHFFISLFHPAYKKKVLKSLNFRTFGGADGR